jgi:hypothetical protein
VFARSLAVCLSAGAVPALLVPEALAVKVRVRVEGRDLTIFGATAPLIDVTSPRANPLPESALDALESASVLGEFYYHLTTWPDVRVDQIGRIAEFGQTSWAYKVNGVAPDVGAAEYRLRPGDSVVWYTVLQAARRHLCCSVGAVVTPSCSRTTRVRQLRP